MKLKQGSNGFVPANGHLVVQSSAYLSVKLVWRQFSATFKSSTQYNKMKEDAERDKSDPPHGCLLEIDVDLMIDDVKTYYGPRTEKLSIPPPKEEMLELVLPKFDEYLMKILSICKITNCLTTDNPDDFQDSENVAVLHRRQSSNSEIPNCLTIDNPDDLHDSENVAVLHRRQNSNSEIPNCLTIENPDDLQDSENVAVLHRRQSSNSEIPNCLTTDNPDDLQDSENVAVLHRRQSSNSEIPNCLNTDNSEDNSEIKKNYSTESFTTPDQYNQYIEILNISYVNKIRCQFKCLSFFPDIFIKLSLGKYIINLMLVTTLKAHFCIRSGYIVILIGD
ncbi:hypothetical protein KUTeg_022723 [Tegillarca granosa]|uniref:Uncharacterized protein n=1 Tax=Tegillarca granosa TaxID=220873 RepID=A0ABQ9E5T4_TEGGR|nr:hypothetical protein KUTeg_022723 [Tegillarca granosa]